MSPPQKHAPAGETVSPAEVERLLAQVGGSDTPATGTESVGKVGEPQPAEAERFQFRELSCLSGAELRKLRLRHEEFTRSLGARLSSYLRLEVGLQMSKLETSHFQNFVEGTSNPTYLALLKLAPLQGICLLEVPPKVGLCIVDRELGGPAQCLDEVRPLTEIESKLLSKVVEIVAGEWCSFWSDLVELRSTLLGYENSASFVQVVPPDTMMLILGMEIRIGEVAEQMQFCFPCATLEPLIVKLNAGIKADKSAAARPAATLKWNPSLNEVRVKVTAELPDMQLTARQLAQLKPGDTLLVTPEMAAQVNLCLAKKPKFTAMLGTSNNRWAAKITDVHKS